MKGDSNSAMLPKVPIFIRSYNQKEFLIEAIESVLNQDYGNLEIVVADDASTDGTKEVLYEYEKKTPDLFKLALNEKKLGMVVNFNSGFKLCTGKYIAFLDGDDLFLPGKIRKQVSFMESHPTFAIVYHDLDIFDSKSGVTIKNFNSGPGSLFPYMGKGEEFVQKIVKYSPWFAPCAVMAKRSACPSYGRDPRLIVHEDWLFWLETAMNGEVHFLPEVLARYRKHSGSCMANSSDLNTRTNYLICLAIIEAKYPHLSRYCRLSRGNYLYRLAGNIIVNGGEGKIARRLLWESLRSGWFHWLFGWAFFKSFFRPFSLNILKKQP